MVTGVTGSIAALGDTWTQQSVQNAFVELLIRLRIIHPFLALGTAAALVAVARATFDAARGWSIALGSLVALQLFAGLTNVALQAPVWMQIVHLALADAVWIAVLVATRKLAVSRS